MMRGWRYLPSLIPGLIVVAGNLTGGFWSWGNALFTLGLLPLLDVVAPTDKRSRPVDSATVPDLILLLNVFLHTTAIVTLLYSVHSGIVQGHALWGAMVSTGLNAGVSGITVAHELIHRKQRWWQNLGIWNLLLVNYTHFYVEHIRGHHRNVGTWDDPATARRGEHFYAYFARTLPGQWKSALHIEAKRWQKKEKAPYGWHNFVIRAAVAQVAIAVGLALLLSPLVMAVYLGQSFIAFFLLETVNYGEHYGLVREKGQKFTHDHAWQSDTLTSRFTLVELSRHADHHMKASKPYHKLESHAESPELPVGYFAMFYLLILPPLWFRIVDPLLDKYPAGQRHGANFG